MKQISYQGYTIAVSVTAEDQTAQSWRLQAVISWENGRQAAKLQETNSFTKLTDAENHALRLAKQWVNNRLGFHPSS